ncbi:MAG: hypothetical protein WBG73_04910 [Coleofasciculaceae cyanobacterium]
MALQYLKIRGYDGQSFTEVTATLRRDSHLPQKATLVLLTNSLSSQQNI